MSKTISALIVMAVLAAGLVATVAATADEPDPRATTGYYIRTEVYTCTSDIICFHPEIVIRCKAGDYAMGGAGWETEQPSGIIGDYQSRPWRKKGAARGWMIDEGGNTGPDDQLTVQVICAKQG